MQATILRAIQHRTARVAISSSAMRGGGSRGVVEVGRSFLGDLDLRPFGTSDGAKFRSHLNAVTRRLVRALPRKARRWGLARKGLNIFLRDCLYTAYLRDRYRLARAEALFEVPLDSITARQLYRAAGGELPHWTGVRRLAPSVSRRYQQVAADVAAKQGTERVHLDAIWWGRRDSDKESHG